MLPPKNNEENRRVLEMFSKLRRKSSLLKYSVNKKCTSQKLRCAFKS
ncbi:hypothetical protein VCR29J2_980081 [Vibrio coralliirubri]|nr:hypothetical protein VCR29J2_980081 [Vibrio coralliirubri]